MGRTEKGGAICTPLKMAGTYQKYSSRNRQTLVFVNSILVGQKGKKYCFVPNIVTYV